MNEQRLREMLADEYEKIGHNDSAVTVRKNNLAPIDRAAVAAMRHVLMECATIAARQVDESECLSCRDANKIWENISAFGDTP